VLFLCQGGMSIDADGERGFLLLMYLSIIKTTIVKISIRLCFIIQFMISINCLSYD
jgi:hypothetical protein